MKRYYFKLLFYALNMLQLFIILVWVSSSKFFPVPGSTEYFNWLNFIKQMIIVKNSDKLLMRMFASFHGSKRAGNCHMHHFLEGQ